MAIENANELMDSMNSVGNINPFEYPSQKCECGNEIFINGVIFKEIPGVLVGSKDKEIIPVPVYVCSKCGEICPSQKKIIEELKKESAGNKKKSSLII